MGREFFACVFALLMTLGTLSSMAAEVPVSDRIDLAPAKTPDGGKQPPIAIRAPVRLRRIPLHLDSPNGVICKQFPIEGGVPIPRGELVSAAHVRILDLQGREVSCQTKKLGSWPGGSLKWLSLVFLADVPKQGTVRHILEYGTNVRPAKSATRVLVKQVRGQLHVDTGAARFTFASGGAQFLATASVRTGNTDKNVLNPNSNAGLYFSLTDPDGKTKKLVIRTTRLVVEEDGPIRVCVRAEATASGGSRPFRLTLRAYAYAGSPILRVFHTFVHTGEPEQEYIGELGMRFALPNGHAESYALGKADGSVRTGKASVSFHALQDKHNHYSLSTGTSGQRLAGWADVSGDGAGLAVVVRNFYKLYPKAFRLDAAKRELTVALWPKAIAPLAFIRKKGQTDEGFYRNSKSYGVAKTHEILIYPHVGDYRQARVAAVAAAFDRPPLPFVSPRWNAATGVVGLIGPRIRGVLTSAENGATLMLDFLLYNQRTEPWYGMMDYGDMQNCFLYRPQTWRYLKGRWGWHGQMYHDFGFYLQYLRTGKRKYFDAGEALTRHIVDVDTIHFRPPGYRKWFDKVGSVHRHNAQHWVDVGENKYTRINGWFTYYFLTGHRRTWDVVEKETVPLVLADTIANPSFEGLSVWLLLQMASATGDAKLRERLAGHIRKLIARQAKDGAFPNDTAENGYYFFCAGWAFALVDYFQLTGDAQVGRAIVRLAARRLRGKMGETWFGTHEAARVLAAAYQQTGDAKFRTELKKILASRYGASTRLPIGDMTKRKLADALVGIGNSLIDKSSAPWKFDIIMADLIQFPYIVGVLAADDQKQ